jgi:putative membrane protein insertion efficiency factor
MLSRFAKSLGGLLSLTMILVVKGYKYFISPIIPARCRYQPSCSEYALVAFQRHGFVRGVYLSMMRLSRCHPWGGSGYDPVPEKQKECCSHSDSLD